MLGYCVAPWTKSPNRFEMAIEVKASARVADAALKPLAVHGK